MDKQITNILSSLSYNNYSYQTKITNVIGRHYIIFLILLIIIVVFNTSVLSSLDVQILRLHTWRDYKHFYVNNDSKTISNINSFLKGNPQKIPKIIHQVWIGPKEVPWKWINSFKEDFMKKHPEWKYYLWTDKEVAKLNLVNKTHYDNEKGYNGKADILRYELLYKFGGIYIDADSYWLGLDLGDLIKQTNYTGFFAAIENKEKCNKCLANGVMGSSVNNPIAKYLVDIMNKQYNTHIRDYAVVGPWLTVGPYYIDQILYKFNITVFPDYYFYPIYWASKNKSSQIIPIEEQKKLYPNSYMTQYGYSTNNLKGDE
jgi:inositol phosphorylceramide mannosyltransferase catalytic subunit